MGIGGVSGSMAAMVQPSAASVSSAGKQAATPSQGDSVQLSAEAVAAMNGKAPSAATSSNASLAQPSRAIGKYLGC